MVQRCLKNADMDVNNKLQKGSNMNTVKAGSNSMSLASLVFGILAVLGSIVIIPTPFLAGLAITFSWLSRGDRKMSNQALAGNILAVAAILISLFVLGLLLVVCFLANRQGTYYVHRFWQW